MKLLLRTYICSTRGTVKIFNTLSSQMWISFQPAIIDQMSISVPLTLLFGLSNMGLALDVTLVYNKYYFSAIWSALFDLSAGWNRPSLTQGYTMYLVCIGPFNYECVVWWPFSHSIPTTIHTFSIVQHIRSVFCTKQNFGIHFKLI